MKNEIPAEKAKRLWTREFILVSCISFLISINFFTLVTVMSGYVLKIFHLGETQAGFATGIFVVGMLISRLFAGNMVTRIGFKPMLMIGIIGLVIFTIFYLFVSIPWILFLIRFLNGCFYGMTSNTNVTIVSSIIPEGRSGEGAGYYSMFQMLAWAIGPYAGTLLAEIGNYTMIFLFCTISSAVGLALIPFLRLPKASGDAPAQGTAAETRPLQTAEHLPLIDRFVERSVLPIAASVLFYMLFNGAVSAFLAVYAEEIGMAATAAVYFLIYAAALLFSRPFVSKVFDRYGANILLIPGILLTSAGYMLLAAIQHESMLLLAAVIIGVGFGALQTATLALTVNFSKPNRRGIANATCFMSIDLSAALGPIIAGALIPFAGYKGMFLIGGLYTLIGLPVYRKLLGARLSQENA